MNTRYAYLTSAAALVATVLLTQLAVAQTARVQLVNASVDPMMETVDVYMDDVLWYDDFEYATAQAFADVLAGTRQVALAPASSVSSSEAFKTLEMYLLSGQKYYAVLSGVLDPGQYDVNPDGLDTSLKLFLKIGALETSSEMGKFEFRGFHGLITGPRLKFWVQETTGDPYELGPLSYGEFSPNFSHEPEQMTGFHIQPGTNYGLFYNTFSFDGLENKAFFSIIVGFIGEDPVTGLIGAPCTANPPGLPELRWLRIFPDGTVEDFLFECSSVGAEELNEVPAAFRVLGNYPNPFNPATTVQFDLAVGALVRVDIYDLLGRRVLQVPEQSFSAGPGQQIRIDASDLASGTYIFRVVARNGKTAYIDGGHMTLLK